jgi:hypothetical protein
MGRRVSGSVSRLFGLFDCSRVVLDDWYGTICVAGAVAFCFCTAREACS